MAKTHSVDETERLLLDLEDLVCTETNELEKANSLAKQDLTLKKVHDTREAISEEFDKLLFESIDEALTSLGEPVKNTLYQHLQKDFNISKEEIPNKIQDFSNVLHKIFGFSAGRLEIKFMKNLCEKVKVRMTLPEYEWPLSKWVVIDVTFPEYIDNARRNFIDEATK